MTFSLIYSHSPRKKSHLKKKQGLLSVSFKKHERYEDRSATLILFKAHFSVLLVSIALAIYFVNTF